ncbi:MAG: AAA family ATPase [Bacteroidetes bacterium]|jgi:NadR type nicotinamide-nucleotide adenylyltransferase|nr:AAA family ATPase [Bacteroidota bacterium]
MRKILFTGPESTGKTQTAQQLAARYHEPWVPEYARAFLQQLGRPYREADLLDIARGQLAAEDAQAKKANNFLFCDTSLIVIKVWSEYKYGRCHPWILEQLARRSYDLIVLCGIDTPWTPDPQREHPDEREELYQIYQRELQALEQPYIELWGSEAERLNKMDTHLKNTLPTDNSNGQPKKQNG